jgi:hypothetical protein
MVLFQNGGKRNLSCKTLIRGGTGSRIPQRSSHLWMSGFDYTDIVKCDGEFFLEPRNENLVKHA